MDEDAAQSGNEFTERVSAKAQEEAAGCIWISGQIEAELSEMEPEDRADFEDPGLEEPGLNKLLAPPTPCSAFRPTSRQGRRKSEPDRACRRQGPTSCW